MRTRRLVLVVLVLAACSKHDRAATDDSKAKGDNPIVAIQRKLHPYIECLNRHSNRILESRARYLDSVDPVKGPKPGQGAAYGGMYETADCQHAIAAAAKLPPSSPALESAGAAYATTIAALEPLMKEASDYYDQERWKDDKTAKGIALHPKLVAAWNAFDKANTDLSSQVETLNRDARTRDLAAREKAHGRKLDVIVDAMMFAAEDVRAASDVPLSELRKLDLPKLQAALDALETRIKETETYAAAHADETAAVNRSFAIFMTNVKSFQSDALALARRVRDKTAFSTGERMNIDNGTESVVNGTPAKALEAYNHLVDSYNGH